MLGIVGRQDRGERAHVIHMTAQSGIVSQGEGEFDGCDDRRRGYVSECVGGHSADIDHEGDAAPRPDVGGRPATCHVSERVSHGAGEAHGILRDPRAQRAARPAHKEDG